MKRTLLSLLSFACLMSANAFTNVLDTKIPTVSLNDDFSSELNGVSAFFRAVNFKAQRPAKYWGGPEDIVMYAQPETDVAARLMRYYERYSTSREEVTTDSLELEYDYNGLLRRSKLWLGVNDGNYDKSLCSEWTYSWSDGRLTRASLDDSRSILGARIKSDIKFEYEEQYNGGIKVTRIFDEYWRDHVHSESYAVYNKDGFMTEYWSENKPYSPITYRCYYNSDNFIESSYLKHNNIVRNDVCKYEYVPELDCTIMSQRIVESGESKNKSEMTRSIKVLDDGLIQIIRDTTSQGDTFTSRIYSTGRVIEKEGAKVFLPIKTESSLIYNSSGVEANKRLNWNFEYSMSGLPVVVYDNETRYEYTWDAKGRLIKGIRICYDQTDNVWRRRSGFEAEYAEDSNALLSTTVLTYSDFFEDPAGVEKKGLTKNYDVDPIYPAGEVLISHYLYPNDGMLRSISKRNERLQRYTTATFEYEILRDPIMGIEELKEGKLELHYEGHSVTALTEAPCRISVHTVSGLSLLEAECKCIDLESLPSGIYIVKAVTDHDSANIKIAR